MKNKMNFEIGNRVRKQREYMRYSRESFAEMIGISLRFLTDIELGTKGMSFATLIKISSTLSVSCDYLLLGKEAADENPALMRTVASIDKEYIPLAEDLLTTFIKTIRKASAV